MEKGTRVTALFCVRKDTAEVIGSGVYEGNEIPPENIGGYNIGLPNPKIVLDSGIVIWGCECWWGPEEDVKKYIEKHQLQTVQVDILEERKKANGKKDS